MELKNQDSKFKCYSLDDKSKAVALVQVYLQENLEDVNAALNELKKELKELKKELKELQNDNNSTKIEKYSRLVTSLYKSGKNDSEIIKQDFNREEFRIEYIKRANVLQPTQKKDDKEEEYLYLGSMARHTLIQLAGYLGFMNLLIKDNKCPIIPMLVIDHLSKPFSDDNKKAVGKIINEFYKEIPKSDMQIFMFDDKEPSLLGVEPDHCEYLQNECKTGFNPFYNGK